MSQAVADQLFLAYMGRPADTQWRSATATLTDALKDQPSAALQTAFYNAAVAEGVFAATDSPSTLVNKIFLQQFGFAASAFEQTAWGNLIANGTISAAGAAWTIFASYLGATNVPAAYQQPAQSKLLAIASFSNALTDPTINAAYSQLASSSSAAGRAYLLPVVSQATAATAITGVANTVSTLANSNGSTFVLTTATDTLVGTSGNDTFNGTAATTGATFNAADTLIGGSGTDTLNLTVDVLAAASVPGATTSGIEIINVRSVSGNAQTIAAGNFAGATSIVSDRSTDALTVTGLIAGQTLTINGNGATTNGALADTYAATVTAATLNVTNGTTAGAITQTAAGVATQTINSTGAANTIGAFAIGGAATALNINAATALVTGGITGFTGTAAKITVTGAATATTGGVTLGTIEAATVAVIDASGLTAGGINATLSANTAIVVTGGAGNDRITTGSALTTGSVNAGAGTADRLTIAADAHVASLALGNKYSGFEIVQIAAAGTQDLDFLATNNTLTGLRLAGTGTVTNVNAATAANVTILAASTPSIGVKGASTPGQIDTVSITVSDEAAAVNTFALTTPVLTGVEILNLTATDNFTISALTSAASLTNVNISGAGTVGITTGAVALTTNYAVNAGTATGNLTFDATGATTNGASIVGSSGINLITGGSQAFSVNLAASVAKADVIALTNATGGTYALANASISGFTNSATATVGDKLDVAGAVVVGKAGAAVAAAATTAVATMTGALSTTGIMTFAGTGAATATLTNKIDASLEAAYVGGTNLQTVAFEHNGNTYVVESDGNAGFQAGADYVIVLTGVTGVTALSTAASGATTIWVA